MTGAGLDSELIFKSATGIQTGIIIESNTAPLELANLKLTGSTNPPTLGRMLYCENCRQVTMHHLMVTGGGANAKLPPPAGGLLFHNGSDVTIEDSEISANGPATGTPLQNTEDIGANYFEGYSVRFRIARNRIHDSRTTQCIGLNNTAYSEISENWINQNNTSIGKSNDGYGVMIYFTGSGSPASHAPMYNRIRGNQVENCAGSCIYLQTSPFTTVANNIIVNSSQQQSDVTLTSAGIAIAAGYDPAARSIGDYRDGKCNYGQPAQWHRTGKYERCHCYREHSAQHCSVWDPA